MFSRNLNLLSNFLLKKLNCRYTMNESSGDKSFKKPKYDWRSKKRAWENRRSDKGESITEAEDVSTEKKHKQDEPFERIKRRKFAVMLGYSGVDYYGMQRNPSSKTIEEELFKALLKANYITQEAFDQIQNIAFQRAARTDKGVSAARQVVSIKLPEDFKVENVNEHLPEVIKVFAAKRVTKGFNSKSQCSARTYMYMFPTVALVDPKENADQSVFRSDEKLIQRVNDILKMYEGTKNFHNFTSKKKPNDPSASRYIMSFVCEPPFVRKGVEFAVMKVKGQSFMMHQIRKMVGLVLAIVRNNTSEETLSRALSKEKVNLPRAPGLGLVLDYVHYDRYNNRYGSDGVHEILEWGEVEDQVSEFKEKYIYPTIIDTEINDKSMLEWLQKLDKHSYDEEDIDDKQDDEDADSDHEDGDKNCKQATA